MHAAQVRIVDFWIDRLIFSQNKLLAVAQLQFQLSTDCRSNLVLHRENILEFAVVGL